jgi:5-formyltetrahydrofolate cyclo-ligase
MGAPSEQQASLDQQKNLLRQAALERRAACDPALGAALCRHVLADCPPPPDAVVAGFWPFRGEIDILPLLHELALRGQKLCLPVTPERGQPLSFRAWRPGDALVRGRFNTMHPESEEMFPDFILTPLAAFDAAGNRIGYGGGYYDRTFAALPHAFRLGCAFAAQQIPVIPASPTDIKLHAIATEAGIIPIAIGIEPPQARPRGSAPWNPAKA